VNREVGIDTEYMRPLEDAMQIADTFFSRHERSTLRKVPEHLRLQAFFSCWTCKEAYVKAVGRGLSQTLDQFDVSFLLAEEAQLLSVDGQPEEVERWKLYAISLPPSFSHYKAALVAEKRGQHAELTGFWQWQKKGD
jgi:4'-phosphopantetheinyl transferase